MEEQVSAFLASSEFKLTYSPSTRLAYESDLRRFVKYLKKTLGRPPLPSDFTAQHVANFLQAERDAGKRPSTLLRRRASLRRFASYLREHCPEIAQVLDEEPELIDQAIETPTPHQQVHFLLPQQIDRLWQIMDGTQHPRVWRDRAILAVLLESALSVGSLLALDLNDVEVDSGRLRIHLPDGDELWLQLHQAASILNLYLSGGRPELNYQPEEPALFISQNGGRMSRQGIWQVLRQWGHKAGLDETLSPRLVRHTAVVNMMNAGESLEMIQALLGHTNPLSTQALIRRLKASTAEMNQV